MVKLWNLKYLKIEIYLPVPVPLRHPGWRSGGFGIYDLNFGNLLSSSHYAQ